MALEDIKKAIIDDAQKQALLIIKKANQEAQDLMQKAQEKEKKQTEKKLLDAKSNAKQIAKSIIINAKIKAKQNILLQKKSIILKITEKLKHNLINSSDDIYEKIILIQIKKLTHLKLKKLQIIPSKGKTQIITKLVKKYFTNPVIKSEDNNINGGFIAISEESKFDLTINSLIEENKNEIEKIINDQLKND